GDNISAEGGVGRDGSTKRAHIRVLIAEATRMGGQLVATALKRCRNHFDVIATTQNLSEAVQAVEQHFPDIAVISADLQDAPLAGFELLLEAIVYSRPLHLSKIHSMSVLTPREEDVVRLVAEGMKNREISLKLNVSEHTVRNYLFRVFDKLGVSNRVELVLYALTGADEDVA